MFFQKIYLELFLTLVLCRSMICQLETPSMEHFGTVDEEDSDEGFQDEDVEELKI